jgi:hypothetical protein
MEERTIKMTELEINRQRAQLLVKARASLNEEYLKNRTNEYELWQAESNRMWISQGILLPCPNKFTYPTEEAVVARALELYNKQAPAQTPVVSGVQLPATDVAMTSSVSARLSEVSQKFKPVVLPEVPTTTPWEQYLNPANNIETTVEPTTPEPVVILEQPVVLPEPEVAIEQMIEDVTAKDEEELTEEQRVEQDKSNSRLRSLLAQFITMAKGLDAKARKDEGTSK